MHRLCQKPWVLYHRVLTQSVHKKNKIVSKPHVLYYILKIISLKLSHPTFTCRYTVAWAAVVHVSCRSQVFDWYICICIIMTLCQLIYNDDAKHLYSWKHWYPEQYCVITFYIVVVMMKNMFWCLLIENWWNFLRHLLLSMVACLTEVALNLLYSLKTIFH